MNNFFKVPEMSRNRLIWVGIDQTSVPAKFGGPGTSRTATMAMFQNCPNFSPKIRIPRRKFGIVLEHGHCDGSRRARASKLCRDTCLINRGSIPTQFNRFWDISGTFKKLFIFVHSVHSGNLGRHFGLPNVRSSSYCPYQSYSTNESRRNTKLNLKTTVPKLSQFCPNVPILFQKSGFINSDPPIG